MKFIKLLLIISLCALNTAFGRESLPKVFADDFMLGVGDFGAVFSDFGRGAWATPLFAVGTTGGAMLLDDEIRLASDNRRTIFLLKQAGEPVYSISASVGIWLTGYFADSPEWRTTGRLFAETLVLAAAVNMGLKYALGRSRPCLEEGNHRFGFAEIDDSRQSMPSGHTTTAFAAATVLSERIGNIYASIALYALACGTACERVIADRHWFSDVILGAEIGYFSAHAICDASERKQTDRDVVFLPLIAPDYVGFQTFVRF